MTRLVLNQTIGGVSAIDLKDGLNRVGRKPDNDFQVEDASISGHHCEIQVTPEGVWVRDLGSTNGTYLDEEPIQEASVQPGQTLRLGSVAMRLEMEEAEVAPGEAVAPPVLVEAQTAVPEESSVPMPDACSKHPSTPAKYICYSCARLYCAACVKALRAGMRDFYSCPACGGTAGLLAEYRKLQGRSDKSFLQVVPGAFAYPFSAQGIVILISGAIFFSLLEWGQSIAKYAFMFGLAAIVIMTVMSGGYLFAFMKGVAASAVSGEDQPPRWPEFSSFADTFVSPFFQLLLIVLLCVGPGVVALMYVHPIAGVGILLCGLFCMPMALLTVSVADSIAGLNPLIIFSSIAKVPGQYLLVCFIFLLTLGARTGLEKVLSSAGLGPLGVPVVQLFSLYFVTVQMRLLGLMYYKNKARLAWFR